MCSEKNTGPEPRRVVELDAGRLELDVRRSTMPLDDLCVFASRYNQARGYLFVSKVLGKHFPARPDVMAEVYRDLAGRMPADLGRMGGPTLVVGMAETATGLAQGVFTACCRRFAWDRAVFLPTTRYVLPRPVALRLDESHCHAREHLLYEPADPDLRQWFSQAETLLLVDDEMSTGNTFARLAVACKALAPRLERIVLATLTCWLGEEEKAALAARFPAPVEFVSLLEGSFRFTPKPGGVLPRSFSSVGDWRDKSACLPRDFGRLGIGPHTPQPALEAARANLRLTPSRPVLVLGTGEFLYQPFRLSALLEREGFTVFCQATTRTPVAVGAGIRQALRFPDNYHDGIDNFLYNVDPEADQQVVLVYETFPLPAGHTLAARLRAQTVFF